MLIHGNVDIVSSGSAGSISMTQAIKDREVYSYSRMSPVSLPATYFNMSSKALHSLLISKFANSDPGSAPQTDIQTAAGGAYSHSFSTGGNAIGCVSSIFVPDNVGIGLFSQGASGLNGMGQAATVPTAQFNEISREMILLTLFYVVVNSEPIPVTMLPTVGTPLVISGALPTGQTITTSLITVVSEAGKELMASNLAFRLDISNLKRALAQRKAARG